MPRCRGGPPAHGPLRVVNREIRKRMLALTPLVQPLSIDAFLDLGGTEALHGCAPAEALVRLQNEIREEIGVTVSVV